MKTKRREPLVLFLDDGFDSPESAKKLVGEGFSVEPFRKHFHRDGRKLEGVPDPSVISLCSNHKWLLVTLDYNMEYTHIEEIKVSEVAILATTNNNHSVDAWVSALVKAKAKIARMFRDQERPYFSRISRDGNITKAVTITADRTSRRQRPQEKISKVVAASVVQKASNPGLRHRHRD